MITDQNFMSKAAELESRRKDLVCSKEWLRQEGNRLEALSSVSQVQLMSYVDGCLRLREKLERYEQDVRDFNRCVADSRITAGSTGWSGRILFCVIFFAILAVLGAVYMPCVDMLGGGILVLWLVSKGLKV